MNVNIPPGRNTGYHTHYADSVSVNLSPASQTNQNFGSSDVSPPGAAAGEGEPGRATFTDVTKNGPRTHKASNVGPTPFHNISFILKPRAGGRPAVSDRSGVQGYTQVMDNARLRAWRTILKPGESTGAGHATRAGPEGLCAGRRARRSDRRIGRSRHGALRGRFHLAGCRPDASREEHGTTLIEFVEFEFK